MGLITVALVAALGVGALLGGSLSRLGAVRLRGWPLVGAAAVVQLAGALLPSRFYAAGLGLSALLALGFLGANRRFPGIALVAGGLLLNTAVVAANGAMPVSTAAAARAGVDIGAIAAGDDPRHELADRRTAGRALGDVVPVALPLRPEVASPGDVTVAVGLALLVVGGMRRAPLRYRPGLVATRRPPAPRPPERMGRSRSDKRR